MAPPMSPSGHSQYCNKKITVKETSVKPLARLFQLQTRSNFSLFPSFDPWKFYICKTSLEPRKVSFISMMSSQCKVYEKQEKCFKFGLKLSPGEPLNFSSLSKTVCRSNYKHGWIMRQQAPDPLLQRTKTPRLKETLSVSLWSSVF